MDDKLFPACPSVVILMATAVYQTNLENYWMNEKRYIAPRILRDKFDLVREHLCRHLVSRNGDMKK